MSSEAQIRANRQNAQKSSGPKTNQGKHSSRQNAARHNLSGTGAGLTPEHQAAVDHLERDFTNYFKPDNPHDALLVHQLALAAFRMDQATIQEFAHAEVNRARDLVLYDDDRNLQAKTLARSCLNDDPSGTVKRLKRTSHGCDWLALQLRLLAHGLDLENKAIAWTEADLSRALDLLGIPADSRHLDPVARWFQQTTSEARSGDLEALDVLRLRLDQEIEDLEARFDELWNQSESRDYQLLLNGQNFDLSPEVQRIRRYESAASRAFWRIYKQLESRRASTPSIEPIAPAHHQPQVIITTTPPPPPPLKRTDVRANAGADGRPSSPEPPQLPRFPVRTDDRPPSPSNPNARAASLEALFDKLPSMPDNFVPVCATTTATTSTKRSQSNPSQASCKAAGSLVRP